MEINLKPEDFDKKKWKQINIVLGVIVAALIVYSVIPRGSTSPVQNEKTPGTGFLYQPDNQPEISDSPVSDTGTENDEEKPIVTPSSRRITEYFQCTRVIDGDTFECEDSDTKLTVRMIGIDTPESVAPEESGKTNTEEGKIVSQYVADMLTGKRVYLEFDEDRTDEYGRTLAYVFLDVMGKQFINEILISEGYAQCMEIEPNTRYAGLFEQTEQEARINNAGFWGTGFFEEEN